MEASGGGEEGPSIGSGHDETTTAGFGTPMEPRTDPVFSNAGDGGAGAQREHVGGNVAAAPPMAVTLPLASGPPASAPVSYVAVAHREQGSQWRRPTCQIRCGGGVGRGLLLQRWPASPAATGWGRNIDTLLYIVNFCDKLICRYKC